MTTEAEAKAPNGPVKVRGIFKVTIERADGTIEPTIVVDTDPGLPVPPELREVRRAECSDHRGR